MVAPATGVAAIVVVVGALATLVAWRIEPYPAVRPVVLALGVWAAVGAAATGAVAVGAGPAVPAWSAFGVCAACALAAALVRLPDPVRWSVEAAAATAVVWTLWQGSLATQSLRWAALGTVLGLIAALRSDRRWVAVGAGASLVISYLLALADRGVDSIEMVTLPCGVLALAVGTWWLSGHREQSSWTTLAAGLVLCLAPSLPQACAETGSVRALLLGAAAVLAVVAGVWAERQAPFVLGTVVLAALFGFSVVPVLAEMRGVLLLAGASVVLGALGITWEDRVRDGRRVLAYVRDLR